MPAEGDAREDCPSENALTAIVSSRASAADAERVFAHLDVCSDCRRLAADMARLSRIGDASGAVAGAVGATTPALHAGDVVGRYVVLQRVGEGGMGVVYAAYDPELDRKVALKIVRPGKKLPKELDPAREARTLARVSHPNVVAVYDVGLYDDRLYVVMQFVAGVTLRRWLEDQPRATSEVLGVLRDAGTGLAAAHRAQIVHRDVKPENVMIDADGRARVADFGLAQDVAPEGDATPSAIAGTRRYMSPEQRKGDALDARTDQFSFAVMAREVLGERVLPRTLAAALYRAAAQDPDQRFESMEALLAAITPPAPRVTPRAAALVVAVVVIASVVVALFEQRRSAALAVCSGADAKLTGTWSAERRDAVARAFAAANVAYGEDSWRTVQGMLDAQAAAWTQAYTASCKATRIQKVQSETVMDQQMACLESRRLELAALVSELAHPTEATIAGSVSAAGALATVASCSDPRTMRARRRYLDPDVDAKAGALEAQVMTAKVKQAVGDFAGALMVANAATATARELGERRLAAQSILVTAEVEFRRGSLAVAKASAQEAVWIAEANADDDLVAEAWLSLYGIALHGSSAAEVAASERHSKATLERLGAPPKERAYLSCLRGQQAFLTADYGLATTSAHDGLQILTALADDTRRETALCESVLGWTTSRQELPEDARRHFSAALAAIESLNGPKHPVFGDLVYALATVDADLGDLPAARAGARRAAAVYQAAGAYKGNKVLCVENLRAFVESRAGDVDEAVVHASAALERTRADLGDSNDTVVAYWNFGDLLVRGRRRYTEARDAFNSGLAMMDRMGMDNPEYRVGMQAGLGRIDVETARPAQALARLEAAVARYEKGDLLPSRRALARLALARALAALHENARVHGLVSGVRETLEKGQEMYRADLDALDAILAGSK